MHGLDTIVYLNDTACDAHAALRLAADNFVATLTKGLSLEEKQSAVDQLNRAAHAYMVRFPYSDAQLRKLNVAWPEAASTDDAWDGRDVGEES